jgi:CBS domain containing-hemolysin-like protein
MSTTAALGVAVALLLANAFFVGAEFALISARRAQIELLVTSGSRAARTTLRAMERVSLVMAGAQLGITACSLGLGALGEPAVAHLIEPLLHAVHVPAGLLHPIAFVIALAIVVYLHVVLGEMVPKNIALAGPERAALVLGPPMMLVVLVLKPVVVTLNAIANGVLRLVRVEPKDEVSSTFTRDEVSAMVDESRHEGMIADEEYDRLSGALDFTERTVERVLLAPETLVTVPWGATVSEVEQRCAETGFSRFPVRSPQSDGTPDGDNTGDDTDREGADLAGYLHVKDVLDPDPDSADRPIEATWLRPFATVRTGTRLHEALTTLQRRGAHLGRVVEQDGSLVGLVTLEDVLEELVGEIRDAAHTS